MPIDVVTWNIQKGIGMDYRRDLTRTGDVLASFDADIVGLQEVLRIDGMDQAATLAERVGASLAWGPAREVAKGAYGNALLVRGEILGSKVHNLSIAGWERRSCLDALVRLREVKLRVLVCHFGLSFKERRQQATRLIQILGPMTADAPRIVMGDFNEWHRGPVRRALGTAFPNSTTPRPSHPSALPLFALDRLVWDDALHGEVEVLPVHNASDHRSLRARLAPVHDAG